MFHHVSRACLNMCWALVKYVARNGIAYLVNWENIWLLVHWVEVVCQVVTFIDGFMFSSLVQWVLSFCISCRSSVPHSNISDVNGHLIQSGNKH